MPKIKMLSEQKVSEDGINIQIFQKDNVYEVSQSLANSLCHPDYNWAVLAENASAIGFKVEKIEIKELEIKEEEAKKETQEEDKKE
jgi:hypothetical protein